MIHFFSKWLKQENGITVPGIYILSLPLILLAFGFGFDSMRVGFIQSYLNTKATAALDATLSSNIIANASGNLEIDPDAPAAAIVNYANYTAKDRPPKQVLVCSVDQVDNYPSRVIDVPEHWDIKNTERYLTTIVVNTDAPSGCLVVAAIVGGPKPVADYCVPVNTPVGYTAPEYGLTLKAKERVNYTFLRVANIDSVMVEGIAATARVQASYASC